MGETYFMIKETLNANSMRLKNQKKIINLLRLAPRSRADLARKTGLTRSAISVLIDSLIQDNIVVEDTLISGKVGRSSMNMKLNPNKYCILGFDIARNEYTVGLSDFSGKILEANSRKYEKAYSAIDVIYDLIKQGKEMLDEHKEIEELLGIGITAPGPLDSEGGIILNPPNFKEWENIKIIECIKKVFKCPIYLENNAKALALAECYFTENREFNSFLELVIDSGIGGGIIIDGKLYKGKYGFSGDIGHITVNIEGEQCNCGNIGCAELYASIPNIINYAMQEDDKLSDWKSIVDEKENGNVIAKKIVDREINLLVTIITTAINLLDLDAIIISGELLYKEAELLQEIELRLNQRFMGRNVRKVVVKPSLLSTRSNVLAATNLVFEQYMQQYEN